MFFKMVLISALYILYSNGLNLTKPEKPNTLPVEDYEDFVKNYLKAMKEDYLDELKLDYAEAFSTAVNRQKRSHKECQLEKLYDINVACMCQSGPTKTMVELPMINGDKSGNTLQMPRCISIERCTSSCSMPTQKCFPTEIEILKIPVSVIRPGKFEASECKMVEIEKHLKCSCKCNMSENDCEANQYFDHQACKCRCNLVPYMCPTPKKPNKSRCKCECPIIKECSSGTFFDENSCKCIEEVDNDIDL